MKANADIVREACHIVWTEGQIDRVEEFSADYAFTDWGFGIEGSAHLHAAAAACYYLTTPRKYHYATDFLSAG